MHDAFSRFFARHGHPALLSRAKPKTGSSRCNRKRCQVACASFPRDRKRAGETPAFRLRSLWPSPVNAPVEHPADSHSRWFATACGGIALGTAVLVLAGWLFQVQALKSIQPGFVVHEGQYRPGLRARWRGVAPTGGDPRSHPGGRAPARRSRGSWSSSPL